MSKYDISLKKLAMLVTPTFLRKPVLSAFLFASISPVQHLQQLFSNYRIDTMYLLKHNGQICYLRAMLNDYFDPVLRRITITENSGIGEPVTLYKREVGRFFMIKMRDAARTKIYRRGYGSVGGLDFWVNVPTDVEFSDERIRAMVNMYKLVSKRFNINRI